MPRSVCEGLIQAKLCEPATSPMEKINRAMFDKHMSLLRQDRLGLF